MSAQNLPLLQERQFGGELVLSKLVFFFFLTDLAAITDFLYGFLLSAPNYH